MSPRLGTKAKAAAAAFLLIALVAAGGPFATRSAEPPPAPADVRVLTLNLLFSELGDLEERLIRTADYLTGGAGRGRPPDLILLQEVVGGPITGLDNAALTLKSLLEERGLSYHYSYARTNNAIGVLTEGNAVLSRWPIVRSASLILPFVGEKPSPEFEAPVVHGAIRVHVKIPGLGLVTVYNTHLCAYCRPEDRLTQARALLDFTRLDGLLLGGFGRPVILGGDFNIHLALPGEEEAYREILAAGFSDVYADLNQCWSCCSEEEGLDGCTFGLPDNPYWVEPARVDYIFVRGLKPKTAEIIFDRGPWWVSDHSGLVTGLDVRR